MQRSEDKEIWNSMCRNQTMDPLRLVTMKETTASSSAGIQRTNHTGNSMEGRETVTVYADSFGHGQELRIHFNRKP